MSPKGVHGVELAGVLHPAQLVPVAGGIEPVGAELDLRRLPPALIGAVEFLDVHGAAP
jgi:hypothetical protein